MQVVFSVEVWGALPLSYQWFKNGSPVSGATDRVLAFGAVQSTDVGQYTVIATNTLGAVTSAPAALALENYGLAWSKFAGTNVTARGVARDAAGALYVCGDFAGTASFGASNFLAAGGRDLLEILVFPADETLIHESEHLAAPEVKDFLKLIRRKFRVLDTGLQIPMSEALPWMERINAQDNKPS
jgi:hypothetical protein